MIDDEIRRAALERFGIANGEKDYNLERIVRVAALATGCEFGVFAIAEGAHLCNITTHGADFDAPGNETAIGHAVIHSGVATFEHAVDTQPKFANDPAVQGSLGVRAYAAFPVFAATKVVIGCVCVMTTQDNDLNTDVNARVLNDCVRLIEDSLLMRGAAIRDPLTGLFNRRFYREQVDNEWRRAMRLQLPISMLVVDIDHFKAYNDSLGHLEGDQVIRRVADIISARIRRAGDTVCRFGGEEYAMVLPATDLSDATDLAENIRAAVERAAIAHPGHPKGDGQVITVSIGTTCINTKADLTHYSASDLLGIADDALYEAKAAGRNCVRAKRPVSYSRSGE